MASCVYCGGEASDREHVIPLSRGGSNDLSNLVDACKPCNSSKGRRTPEEWRSGVSLPSKRRLRTVPKLHAYPARLTPENYEFVRWLSEGYRRSINAVLNGVVSSYSRARKAGEGSVEMRRYLHKELIT